jgi:hypothetical protein
MHVSQLRAPVHAYTHTYTRPQVEALKSAHSAAEAKVLDLEQRLQAQQQQAQSGW